METEWTTSHTARRREPPILVGLMLIAAIAGWFVPEFYDWTGADQSRAAPIVPVIALAIVATDCLLIGALARIAIPADPSSQYPQAASRFTLSQLMILTTVAALLLAIGQWTAVRYVVGLVLYGIVSCYALRILWTQRHLRVRLVTIWLCQLAPFIWIVRGKDMMNIGYGLFMLPGSLPGLIPAAIVAELTRTNFEQWMWLAQAFTALALVVGIGIAKLGPKRTIAYGLFLLTLSLFSSFAFNALIRA